MLEIFFVLFSVLSCFSAVADQLVTEDPKMIQSDFESSQQLLEIDKLIGDEKYTLALGKVEVLISKNPSIPKLHLIKATIISKTKNDQLAIDYLTEEITKDPSNIGLVAARAQFLLANGYLESAQTDFYYVYKHNHRPVDVLNVLSDIEKEKGNIEKATDLISQALAIAPEEDKLWFKKAQLELKAGKVAEAKISSFKASELNTENLNYHKLNIEILIFLKQRQEMEEYIKTVYEKFPTDSWLSLRLSTLYVENRDLNAAKDVLVQALKSNPDDYLLMFQLATILAGEGRWEESLTFFKSGLSHHPSSSWAMIQISKIYLKTGDLESAIQYLEMARAEESEDSFVYETLARIYNRKNDTFEAERIILEGLSINSKNQTLILEYANLLEKRGNTRETAKTYEEALKQEPDNSFILGKLGSLYRASGDYDKSVEVLEKAINVSPKSSWIRAYYIDTLTDLEKWDMALSEIRALLELEPDDYWAYAKKALIEFETNKLDEALDSIKKSIELRPDADWMKEIEGRILEGLRQYELAEKAFQTALDHDPDNTFLLTRLAYVQVNLDKGKALVTIEKALNSDDFDINTIELYIYLSDLSNHYWGFSKSSEAYSVYQHIIYKRYDEAEKGLSLLKSKNSNHFPFLSYFLLRIRKENHNDYDFGISLKSVDSQWHLFYMGTHAIRKKDYPGARIFLEKGLAIANKNPWLLIKLGYAYQQLKEHDQAVQMLNRFFQVKKDGEFSWVQLRLALNYDLAKQYLDSERVYKEILVKKPEDNVALNNLAWMYLNAEDEKLHKLDEALSLALRAVEIQPSPANLDTLAEAYFQLKDYDRALKTIERALDKDRRDLDDFKKTKKKILRAMEEQENQKQVK